MAEFLVEVVLFATAGLRSAICTRPSFHTVTHSLHSSCSPDHAAFRSSTPFTQQ